MKGPSPAKVSTAGSLTIRPLGGTVGGFACTAAGTPHFSDGEELILFSRDFGAGWQRVIGGEPGAIRIKRKTSGALKAT